MLQKGKDCKVGEERSKRVPLGMALVLVELVHHAI
jgi:hypothetical protein